jgi:hypothetical protein
MLSIHEHRSVEDASADLLGFILEPINWVVLDELKQTPALRPGQNPDYQRQVGLLRICASVDVTATLEVYLRIAFRAQGLTPARAADHLADFVRGRIPLIPNAEWQVQVDEKGWFHFMRRYAPRALAA